ncbi:MAG TPA: glycosyltransferase family 39 protein [Opitutaceae bacterium]|nr:glycosyltransferase family 39 protein [Opitutaceae bacterium]
MSQKAKPQSDAETSWWRDLILLSVVFGALLAWKLGSAPLTNPDEGRYAEIPREMIASGDWVTPRLDGVPYFEKPPLTYWIVAACEEALGPSEWSVRLAPALFALGGILASYAAVRKIYGRGAGFWTAAVLGTSLLYVALAHLVSLDVPLSVLMSATLFCFILGVREPPGARRRALFYGLYASAALATLTKGLEGTLVTGAVMFLWLLIFNQWGRLLPLYLPSGIALFAAIAAPWHVLVASRNPGWAHFYFVYEHWERFTDKGHGRYQPFYFFVPIVILGLFPWTGFLWSSLRDALAGGWSRRRENAEAWFFATWAAFVLLFFSISQSKLIPYILPLFPPLAVLIGRWLAAVVPQPDAFRRMRTGLRVFAFLCGLIAAALCVAVLKPGMIRDASQAAALRPYAFVLAAILVVGGIRALVPRAVTGPARGAIVAMTATFVFVFGVLTFAMPIIDLRSSKDVAVPARGIIRPGDRVYGYHGFFHDFTYYTGDVVGLVSYRDELELQFLDPAELKARFIDDAEFRREWAGPGRVLAVARIRDAAALFADPGFRYHLLAAGQHHYLFSNQP